MHVRLYIRVRKEDELFGIGRVRIEYDCNGYEYGTKCKLGKVRIWYDCISGTKRGRIVWDWEGTNRVRL